MNIIINHNQSKNIFLKGLDNNPIKTIGYDFDGVIHKTVGKPMKNGQRYAIGNDFELNDKIYNVIKRNNKNNQYIITARPKEDREIINNTLKKFGLKFNKIIYTNGNSKVNSIKKLNINEYYDDSYNVIEDIKFKWNELHQLKKLFFVIPEYQKIIQIKKK